MVKSVTKLIKKSGFLKIKPIVDKDFIHNYELVDLFFTGLILVRI